MKKLFVIFILMFVSVGVSYAGKTWKFYLGFGLEGFSSEVEFKPDTTAASGTYKIDQTIAGPYLDFGAYWGKCILIYTKVGMPTIKTTYNYEEEFEPTIVIKQPSTMGFTWRIGIRFLNITVSGSK